MPRRISIKVAVTKGNHERKDNEDRLRMVWTEKAEKNGIPRPNETFPNTSVSFIILTTSENRGKLHGNISENTNEKKKLGETQTIIIRQIGKTVGPTILFLAGQLGSENWQPRGVQANLQQ